MPGVSNAIYWMLADFNLQEMHYQKLALH